MDADKLRQAAKDSGFISGVYNYCDGWCERCPFTTRCLNYHMREEDGLNDDDLDVRNKEFWDKFAVLLHGTLEMLVQDAKERGIDLDPAELEAIGREEDRRRGQVEGHDLARVARDYGRRVDEWFELNEASLKKKEDDLAAAARMALPAVNPAAQAATIRDALEVIGHYQYLIYAKLARALDGHLHPDEDDDAYPRDADGSAKVALIAVDRSLAAWGTLRRHLPDEKDSILDLRVHLDRLRRRIEQTFPKARAFRRAGFDA